MAQLLVASISVVSAAAVSTSTDAVEELGLIGIPKGEEFWKDNRQGGWAAFTAVILISLWQLGKWLVNRIWETRNIWTCNSDISDTATPDAAIYSLAPAATTRSSVTISDADLKVLIDNLDDKVHEDEKWKKVIDKANNLLSYKAKCCKPQDGPVKYLSTTVFQNCSPETLRDFYMDNNFRKQWDRTLVEHRQLHVDESTGIEFGWMIKKFPLLTPREYVLAWKVWEGTDQTFYCCIKECEHPLVARQKKYVRVGLYRSGWRIRKVPGTTACEIKLVHQEDTGMNAEMAKLAFAKGIWSYVCKMESALRLYSSSSYPGSSPTVTAVTLIQKVPPLFDVADKVMPSDAATTSGSGGDVQAYDDVNLQRSTSCSKKLIANGLLMLGGILCLSHGRTSLGAKVAVAIILKKLKQKQGTRVKVQQLVQATLHANRYPLVSYR